MVASTRRPRRSSARSLGGLAAIAPDRCAHAVHLDVSPPFAQTDRRPCQIRRRWLLGERRFAARWATSTTTASFPVVGATLAYVRDPLRMMRQQYDDLGPVSEIDFLGSRWTVLLGPDACGAALLNADKALASGPGWGKLVGPFFDRGLMLLDFEEHHQHRRLMQQAFTRRRLAGYTAALGPAVAAGLDDLGAGRRVPDLPRAQGAHPRAGHPGVHGRGRPRLGRRA